MPTKILIVIDYQNDFVSGSLGFAGAELLEPLICAKIEAARADGAEVAFTFDTHGADYLSTREGQDLPVPHCIKGEPGWELYGRVADLCTPDSRCFEKPTFGSFELAQYLRDGGHSEVELCGLVSNICVISNAALARAALPEAIIKVDAACTGAGDPAINQKALDVMQSFFIQITNR